MSIFPLKQVVGRVQVSPAPRLPSPFQWNGPTTLRGIDLPRPVEQAA